MVSLHAAPDGKRLYEREGFEVSNEMRLDLLEDAQARRSRPATPA